MGRTPTGETGGRQLQHPLRRSSRLTNSKFQTATPFKLCPGAAGSIPDTFAVCQELVLTRQVVGDVYGELATLVEHENMTYLACCREEENYRAEPWLSRSKCGRPGDWLLELKHDGPVRLGRGYEGRYTTPPSPSVLFLPHLVWNGWRSVRFFAVSVRPTM